MLSFTFQELDSLLSDHFGRTPTASQNSEFGKSCPTDNEEALVYPASPNIQQRAHRFMQESTPSDSEAEYDDDPCYAKISHLKESGCGCSKLCIDKYTEQDYIHSI